MKRHPLLAFFVLMFVISWGIWLPLPLLLQHFPTLKDHPGWIVFADTAGAFGPCFAALIVTDKIEGLDGLTNLFRRFLIWRVGWGWYLIAFLLPAGISLVSTGLHLMFGGDLPDYSHPPIYSEKLPAPLMQYNAWTLLVPFFLLALFTRSSLGEEIGWRGFALARLQQRFSALIATLILAFIWALWVQPRLHRLGHPGYFLPFLVTLLGTVPTQILMTWVFNSTRGSLLLVVLLNNTFRINDYFVTPPASSPLVPVLAYWIVTLVIVTAVGATRLTLRREPATGARLGQAPPGNPLTPL